MGNVDDFIPVFYFFGEDLSYSGLYIFNDFFGVGVVAEMTGNFYQLSMKFFISVIVNVEYRSAQVDG